MKYRTTAPEGLSLPPAVVDAVRKAGPITDHGFEDSVIGVNWWNTHLAQKGSRGQVTLVPHDGSYKLTRGDLFNLADAARAEEASDDTVLSFLCSVFAWGTGRSQRGNSRRLDSLTSSPDASRNMRLVREAMSSAAAGDTRAAYSGLIRRGGGRIAGLGPAFFTKILYFASEGAAGTRCLILDSRVAANLAKSGWSSLPSARGTYSYNWYTDTYVSYCEMLGRWANEATDLLKQPVRPDEIERALFQGI